MQTYMKINQMYLFVRLHLSGNQLTIYSQKGIGRTKKKVIDLEKIDCLHEAHAFGNQQIYFSYEGNHYWIYESGLGLLEYLTNHFVAKVG
ncbi:hypothetical protein ACYSNO_04135 [Enterococcus sp. LJL98]